MTKLWNKLYKIFSKTPVRAESMDGGELLALLRMAGFSYALYAFLLAAVLGCLNGFDAALPPIIGGIIFAALLIISYMTAALGYLLATSVYVLVFTGYMELATGGRFGIGMAALAVIPLIFSSIRLSTLVKIIYGTIIAILDLAVGFAASTGIVVIGKVPENGTLIIEEITKVFFAILVMMVSYYFCRQFTQAEHQVYVINRQLKKMASLDPLTGLMNRRGMSDVLPDMEEAYRNGSSGLSIAIGDIDFFKKVNDTYGHDCGDYVLKTVSSYFAKYMDGKGEICRWGGEEFLFAFSDKNADDVFVMLNDMRHAIKHMHFEFNGISFNVTMTFGLEEYTPYVQLDSTIKKADEKLYMGKEAGRDRVIY